MSLIVYINGYLIDLEENQSISRTLQVNDIGNISNRQANFTSRIKAPKTANNIRTLNSLGLTGAQSNVPYQKNTARILDDSGECIVYNGWATVNSSDQNYYDIVVYDGNIDFYKAIENKMLTDIGLSELNHLKNLDGVLQSWNENLPYIYLHADYNGKLFFDGDKINIDYYIPSANVKFIWDKIFEFYGFTYSGSIFETEAFKNLWLTYPKPVGSETQLKESIKTQTFVLPLSYVVQMPGANGVSLEYVTMYENNLLKECFSNPLANSFSSSDGHCRSIQPVAAGLYYFTIKGYLENQSTVAGPIVRYPYNLLLTRINTNTGAITSEEIITNVESNQQIDIFFAFNASEFEKISLNTNLFSNIRTTGNLEIEFGKIIGEEVNFENALIDFPVKDFVNEVLQRFFLTPFPDKFTNNIRFLTASEWLQSPNTTDWSKNNPKMISESYKIGSYAQKNYFRFRYNDENADHYDGVVYIDNVNLDDVTTVIQSKTYAPENISSNYIKSVKVYPFWNKEVKENAEGVNYKPLDKRFYFMKSSVYQLLIPVKIGSEVFQEETQVMSLRVENSDKMSFKDLVRDYYKAVGAILNTSKLVTAEVYLTVQEYNNFDFSNLVFIEQFASYYICNKISNFIKGKATKVELIEVDYFDEANDGPVLEVGTFITISDISQNGCELVITFDTDAPLPASIQVTGTMGLIFPVIFNEVFQPNSNSITISVPIGGYWNFQLFLSSIGNAIYSNNFGIDVIACAPPVEPGSYITITSIETLSLNIQANKRKVRIHFETDFPQPSNFDVTQDNPDFWPMTTNYLLASNFIDHEVPYSGWNNDLVNWSIVMSRNSIFSNLVYVI